MRKGWITLIIAICIMGANVLSVTKAVIRPSLIFNGTTAECSVLVSAAGKDINVSLELWQGETLLITWSEAGTSSVRIYGTYDCEPGQTYTLTLKGSIDGNPVHTTSVSGTVPEESTTNHETSTDREKNTETPKTNEEIKMDLLYEFEKKPSFEELAKAGTPVDRAVLEEINQFFKPWFAGRFLVMNYQHVEEMNFFLLLGGGYQIPGENGEWCNPGPITQEERALLEERFEEWRSKEGGEYKILASDIDKALLKYTGLSLSQTKQYGMDHYSYLPETDTYYGMKNRDDLNTYRIENAVLMPDGTYLAYWIAEKGLVYEAGDCGIVRLRREESGWQIMANKVEKRCLYGWEVVPLICFYEGSLENARKEVFQAVRQALHEAGVQTLSEYPAVNMGVQTLVKENSYCVIYPGNHRVISDLKAHFSQYGLLYEEAIQTQKQSAEEMISAVIFIPADHKDLFMEDLYQ